MLLTAALGAKFNDGMRIVFIEHYAKCNFIKNRRVFIFWYHPLSKLAGACNQLWCDKLMAASHVVDGFKMQVYIVITDCVG